jgi:HD-GYP domain-containing protein (c-di-GMP phosphodiesterase class II)
LKKDQIHVLARLVQVADEMDELTSFGSNPSPMTPIDALNSLLAQNRTSQGGEKYDTVILEQIIGIFLRPESAKKVDAENVREIFAKAPEVPRDDIPADADLKRRRRHKIPS